jgi:hypothetical protein
VRTSTRTTTKKSSRTDGFESVGSILARVIAEAGGRVAARLQPALSTHPSGGSEATAARVASAEARERDPHGSHE